MQTAAWGHVVESAPSPAINSWSRPSSNELDRPLGNVPLRAVSNTSTRRAPRPQLASSSGAAQSIPMMLLFSAGVSAAFYFYCS